MLNPMKLLVVRKINSFSFGNKMKFKKRIISLAHLLDITTNIKRMSLSKSKYHLSWNPSSSHQLMELETVNFH